MKKETNHDNQSISSTSTNDNSSLFTQIGIKSHGTVTFPRNYSSKAKFIRIPLDASPEKVKDLIFRQHKQKCPSLVLTVIGTAKAYNMKSKLFQLLRQGLVNVAKTAEVWIVTSAGTTCISKLMGKIARTNPDPSHPMYLVGISQWKYIAGVEQLDVQGSNVIYLQSTNDGKNKKLLEPNHTHFILVDDIPDAFFIENVPFLGQLEKAFIDESISLHIPTVLLVIKGGYEDLEKVYESVVKNKVPVILLEGSGGCCNVLYKCYHLYDKYRPKTKGCDGTILDMNDSLISNKQIRKEIREKLLTIYYQSKDDLYHKSTIEKDEMYYFELIYECLQTRFMYLNFIDLTIRSHIKPAIDSIILQAFFNVTTGNDLEEMNINERHKLLNLAFEWKRLDIVKNFIVQDDRDWKSFGLNDIFEKALLQNQVHFIQLFLDYDFPLDELFNNNMKILSLYEHENYQFEKNFDHSLQAIFHEIIEPLTRHCFNLDAIFDLDEIDVEKELFLWSILTGKQELALLFWARGRNKVCAALFATLLYKNKIRKEKDLIYRDYADQFQNLAVQILKNFYLTNPCECTQAIIREIPQFGNMTWLHLAVMAEAKLFIAERAVQKILRSIWYGHIDQNIGKTKIVLASFILGYSGFLSYHKDLIKGSGKCSGFDSEEELEEFFQSGSSKNQKKPDPTSLKLMDKIFNEEENAFVIHDTNPWKKIKYSILQYFTNISLFLQAPYVKYLYNLYFHMLFLLLFSYVILCDFHPLYNFQENKNISNTKEIKNPSKKYKHELSINEIILDIWIFTLFCEEIRQILSKEVFTLRAKIRAYFDIIWNRLDTIAIILFVISVILRWLPSIHCYSAARIILAIDLSLWYIRTLDIFSAIKKLGPKLAMIGEMVHDMKFYMTMLSVFILAYGVPAYSLLYGIQELNWHIPRTILNFAYWPIFGELPILDDLDKNYSINGYIVFILLIAYIIVASVLLINLLIAMFSNTFERLHTDADCIWKFQHYSLVRYHLRRPLLPPPLVIFAHIYRAAIYILSYVFKSRKFNEVHREHKDRSKFRIITNEIVTKRIETIEDAIGNDAYYSTLKSDRKQDELNEEQVYSSDEIILNKIKTIEDRQEKIFESLEYLMNAIEQIVGDEVEMPKQSREDLESIFTKWKQVGLTVAGKNGEGNESRQLCKRLSLIIDDEQTIYIADTRNHRIVEWKHDAISGRIIVGVNGEGNPSNRLDRPTSMIIHKESNSFIIADSENRRVMQWFRQDDIKSEQLMVTNIDCQCVAIDNDGSLYISVHVSNEVSRWKKGERNGVIVAGENGRGERLDQFNTPTFIFIDDDYSLYVSDHDNHRVMKWIKDSKQGIVVAGGNGKGSSLRQLSYPAGLAVDEFGRIYIGDAGNHRVMCWLEGANEGIIIVGGNGKGDNKNQLNDPRGLSFDQQGNLYVVDRLNHRIQKFEIE